MIADDVSERSLQKGGPGEWIKAKSYDSFGPLGPWLVTKDEVPDPQALGLALDLNGTRMQTGNTSTMIFSVAHLVSYISRFMTLMPGDVDHHRHAARRRHGAEPAGVPEGRRSAHAHRRGAGRAAPYGRGRGLAPLFVVPPIVEMVHGAPALA